MDIIDDCTGMMWCIPLPTKSNAFPHLCAWKLAIEAHTGDRVVEIISDNGELKSCAMADWCAKEGITHLFTSPYTSAQNGRVERLHLTLSNKARAMRLACKAPPSFWDEFLLTASYLSTLTPTSSNSNITPF
jgi:transposase InsO family protein